LAIEKNADLVILDDFAARKIAIELGLEVKGTLGILKKLVGGKKIGKGDMRIMLCSSPITRYPLH
jgi:predicted nucleic acid-binding protein